MLWSRVLGLRCSFQLGSGSIGQRTIFSFFRKKAATNQDDDSLNKLNHKSENEGSHAELIWSEAKKEFEKNALSKVKQPGQETTLKRSQIRRLKKFAFLDVIELFKLRSGKSRRGFNEFIQAALLQMKDYEVADDLEVYKALLGVLPRGGTLRPTTFLHAEMGAFKRQQDTVSQLLMQLNSNQVLPDDDVGKQIVEVFGFKSHAMTHYRRMMYWVPKLRHANPWPVVEQLPDDLAENAARLAQLVAARICPDANTEFTRIDVEQPENREEVPCCLVGAQSETQRALLSAYASSPDSCTTDQSANSQQRVFYLDGPQFIWFRQLQVAYYMLWADLDSKRLQHQLELKEKETEGLVLLDDDSWNYRVYGSDREKAVVLQPVEYSRQHEGGPTESAPTLSSGLALKPKRDSLMRSDAATRLRKKALWSALTPGHCLTHLPEQLTRHEQAEGSILALGVVGPVGNALTNQAIVFEWEASKGMQRDQEGIPQSLPPDDLPTVPASAPPQLIRNWLKDLRVQNPALDGATVVMRAYTATCPSPVEESVNEDIEEEKQWT